MDCEDAAWGDGPASRAMLAGGGDLSSSSSDDESDEGGVDVPATENDPSLRSAYAARAEGPSNLRAHLHLITNLRSRGGRAEQLRDAREECARRFALPPAVWRQWILDEARGRNDEEEQEDEEARQGLADLCENALADYNDIPIWETYLQIATGAVPSEESDDEDGGSSDEENEKGGDAVRAARSRALFESAVVAAGMHYTLGARIWRMFRAFERGQGGDVAARVLALYERQLALPIKGCEDAAARLRGALQQDAGAAPQRLVESAKALGAALRVRSQCEAFEAAISTKTAALDKAWCEGAGEGAGTAETLHNCAVAFAKSWVEYGAWAAREAHVPLALSIFERGVAAACNHASGELVWQGYLRLSHETLRDAALTLRVSSRARRAFPAVGAFHLCHMRALERSGAPPSAVEAARDAALGLEVCAGQVLLGHAAFCRRQLTLALAASEPVPSPVALGWAGRLRESLAFGDAFLAESCGAVGARLSLLLLRASVEEELLAPLCHDRLCDAARAVWQEGAEAFPAAADVWRGWAAFERRRGLGPEPERRVWRRGVQALGGAEQGVLCDAWLAMECLRGDLGEWEDACARVERLRQEADKRTAATERRAAAEAPKVRSNAKVPESLSLPAPAAKKRPVANTIGSSGTATDIGPPPPLAKRARKESLDDGADAPEGSKSGSVGSEARAAPASHLLSALFVANLPFDVTEDAVRAAIADASGLETVSVTKLVNRAGRFRGMASVSMASDDAAATVLATTGGSMTLGGRSLTLSRQTVAISKRVPKEGASVDEAGAAAGGPKWPAHPTTVFVHGLALSETDAGLRAVFEGCGAITAARLLVDKISGAPKGQGLVQFQDPAAVPKALALASSGITVEPSRFPAAVPSSTKPRPKPKATNPYLSSASHRNASPAHRAGPPETAGSAVAAASTMAAAISRAVAPLSSAASAPASAKFSFMPRVLRRAP